MAYDAVHLQSCGKSGSVLGVFLAVLETFCGVGESCITPGTSRPVARRREAYAYSGQPTNMRQWRLHVSIYAHVKPANRQHSCSRHLHCVSKNIPDVFSYNLRKHCRIFIIFGRNIIEKVSNQKMLHIFPFTFSVTRAEHYENPTMLSRVTAKKSGVFLRHSV